MHSLIFFVLCLAACGLGKGNGHIALVFEKDKATGISIPKDQLPGLETGAMSHAIQVSLEGNGQNTDMLGDFSEGAGGYITFKPLIPLSPGERYVISYKGKQIGHIAIPINRQAAPRLLAIFPGSDTLPENLLKIYLQFSKPMREGQSQKYVALLDMEHDTVPGVFLDLQPELWNKNRTVLTLWLDPGRIKRGLQPNERMGNPLRKGKRYTISISGKWPSSEGLPLAKTYAKQFITTERDGASPPVAQWDLELPRKGTTAPLIIGLRQPLDHFLLTEALQVQDEKGNQLQGTFRPIQNDRAVLFSPGKPWQEGKYMLTAEPRLEDLAGNNLDRLFDNDMKGNKPQITARAYLKSFEIK